MANRYWVGGSGTWDATTTTNWSAFSGGAGGASAPGTNDAAIFDANSNTGTNDFTVTLSGSPTCHTVDTTGIDPANSMTVAGSGSLTVSGASLTLTSKVVWSNTGTLTFSRTAGSISITTGGVSISSNVVLSIVGASPTVNFVDNFTCTGSVTFNGGTLNTTGNNKIITVAAFLFANSAAKTIALGTNARLFITGNNRTVLDLATGAGSVTWTSPGFLGLSYSGSIGTRTINMGSAGVGPAAIQVTAGSDTVAFTSGDVAKSVNFTGFTGTWSNVTMTMTGSLTTSASMTLAAGSNPVTFTSSCTLSTGGATYNFPVVLNGVGATFTASGDITVAPTYSLSLIGGNLNLGANNLIAGSLISSGSSSRSITRTTGNVTLTGNSATIATLTGTGFTYTAGLSLTCTYSGSTGTRTLDITQSGIPVNVSAGSDTVAFTANNSVGSVNFTGFSGTWSNVAMSVSNNLTLSSSMITGAGANTVSISNSTLTTSGVQIRFPISVSSVVMADDLNSTQSVNASGSFDANNKNINISTFSSSNTNTRTIAMGSGTWTLSGDWNCLVSSGMTLTGTAAIKMTSASAKLFAGGGKTYTSLENAGAGVMTIANNGNVITTLSNSVSPTGFSFDTASGGSIIVTNFNVSGTPGNLVTITRDSQGPYASLTKTSGTVSVQYCSIQSSAPTGGARWIASYSLGNINAGYNENWIFSNGSDAFFDFF